MDKSLVITLSAGSVEYSVDDAAVSIDELIDVLAQARDDGATHVAGTSGNYRGPQWVRLGLNAGWADEEDY